MDTWSSRKLQFFAEHAKPNVRKTAQNILKNRERQAMNIVRNVRHQKAKRNWTNAKNKASNKIKNIKSNVRLFKTANSKTLAQLFRFPMKSIVRQPESRQYRLYILDHYFRQTHPSIRKNLSNLNFVNLFRKNITLENYDKFVHNSFRSRHYRNKPTSEIYAKMYMY